MTDNTTATRQEIRVQIVFWNGERIEQRFATCEEAWSFQRETSKKAANRRKKSDRVETQYAFYVGCTVTGKTYGGWLVGGNHSNAKQDLEHEMNRELFKQAHG